MSEQLQRAISELIREEQQNKTAQAVRELLRIEGALGSVTELLFSAGVTRPDSSDLGQEIERTLAEAYKLVGYARRWSLEASLRTGV